MMVGMLTTGTAQLAAGTQRSTEREWLHLASFLLSPFFSPGPSTFRDDLCLFSLVMSSRHTQKYVS